MSREVHSGPTDETQARGTPYSGDPASGPLGYFNIELAALSQRAQTFTLENQFIRSSFPQITQISFGVSSITYTTSR